MAEKTNALSELAFRLDAAHTEMIAGEIPRRYCNYVEAAKRIVNELAKVPLADAMLNEEYREMPTEQVSNIIKQYQSKCISVCSTIAREAVSGN